MTPALAEAQSSHARFGTCLFARSCVVCSLCFGEFALDDSWRCRPRRARGIQHREDKCLPPRKQHINFGSREGQTEGAAQLRQCDLDLPAENGVEECLSHTATNLEPALVVRTKLARLLKLKVKSDTRPKKKLLTWFHKARVFDLTNSLSQYIIKNATFAQVRSSKIKQLFVSGWCKFENWFSTPRSCGPKC